MTTVLKTWRQYESHWIHTMLVILSERLLITKINLITMSFLANPHSFFKWKQKMPSQRLQNPKQFLLMVGSPTFVTDKTTTVAASSHWGSKNACLYRKCNNSCLTNSEH